MLVQEAPSVSPRLRTLPASAKLVYVLLWTHGGPLTQADLRSVTGLSADTVRRALDHLERADAVVAEPDPDDGRRQRYRIPEHSPAV